MTIPTAEQAKEGCDLAIRNAERLIACGKLLADEASYGPAVSLTVLGAEEAIKGVMLAAISAGFAFDASSIREFLTRHKPRHAVAALWVLYSFVMTKWMSIIEDLKEEYPNHQGDGYESARKQKVADLVAELNALADAPAAGHPVLNELDWWRDSDTIKQCGFYVDFSQDGWGVPESLDEDDFEQASEAASRAMDYAHSAAQFLEKVPTDIRDQYISRMRHTLKRFRPNDRQ
jgi:AbiV family abortive infection protein